MQFDFVRNTRAHKYKQQYTIQFETKLYNPLTHNAYKKRVK